MVFPVFDGHNDTVLRLYRSQRPVAEFFTKTDQGHIDIPRAIEGGLRGGLFALHVPNPAQATNSNNFEVTYIEGGYRVALAGELDHDYARARTDEELDLLSGILTYAPNEIKMVQSKENLNHYFKNDRQLSVVLHFEGAEAIDPDCHLLEHYYARGLRSIGIVWSRPNAFGYGTPFYYPHSPDVGPGLSEHGKLMVRVANELGIMLDLAHLNEQGFRDVARLSHAPLVVSHTTAHAICPSSRAVTDDQLKMVQDSDGVVGICFINAILREDGDLKKEATIKDIVRHFDHISGLIGIDHVAFGSDFDGAQIPPEVYDVTGLPKVLDALSRNGYDMEMLEKIAWKNWFRVLQSTWHDA